jgi:hypothetical protein
VTTDSDKAYAAHDTLTSSATARSYGASRLAAWRSASFDSNSGLSSLSSFEEFSGDLSPLSSVHDVRAAARNISVRCSDHVITPVGEGADPAPSLGRDSAVSHSGLSSPASPTRHRSSLERLSRSDFAKMAHVAGRTESNASTVGPLPDIHHRSPSTSRPRAHTDTVKRPPLAMPVNSAKLRRGHVRSSSSGQATPVSLTPTAHAQLSPQEEMPNVFYQSPTSPPLSEDDTSDFPESPLAVRFAACDPAVAAAAAAPASVAPSGLARSSFDFAATIVSAPAVAVAAPAPTNASTAAAACPYQTPSFDAGLDDLNAPGALPASTDHRSSNRHKRSPWLSGARTTVRVLFSRIFPSNASKRPATIPSEAAVPRDLKGVFSTTNTSTEAPAVVRDLLLATVRDMGASIEGSGYQFRITFGIKPAAAAAVAPQEPDTTAPAAATTATVAAAVDAATTVEEAATCVPTGYNGIIVGAEVCRVSAVGVTGIRLRRIRGDLMEFNRTCKDMLARLKL